ncbi:MAG: hypothetical protein IPM59_12225 [Chloracidobacterium sp.]|nr:hypothetical protein [Chloracidobacterium sp.]
MYKITAFLFTLILVSAAVAQTKLPDFAGMSGCWERRDDAKKLLISEQWMAVEGTSIIGMSRTVKNGKTTDWEFMRIEERTDGIYFVAKPKANPTETDFRLISTGAAEFIFENKAHDFPQRVIYKAVGDKLAARIEGTIQGKSKGIDFPLTRGKCG